ncbi:hypothetical protein M2164_000103 [Streptomyces sp. SAI-208]|nr:hypothetical protein [Streptomyces sp. SAI-208]
MSFEVFVLVLAVVSGPVGALIRAWATRIMRGGADGQHMRAIAKELRLGMSACWITRPWGTRWTISAPQNQAVSGPGTRHERTT